MIKLTVYKSCKDWKIYLKSHLTISQWSLHNQRWRGEVNTSELLDHWITILNSTSRSDPAPQFVRQWSLITNNTIDIRRAPSALYWQACKKLKTQRNYKFRCLPTDKLPTHINFTFSCFSAPCGQIWANEDTFWYYSISGIQIYTRP